MKNKNILKLLAISFLVSLTFEIIQLFSLIGGFSFNDLITNSLGGVLGYFVYLVFHKTKHIGLFISKVRFLLKSNEDFLSLVAVLSRPRQEMR